MRRALSIFAVAIFAIACFAFGVPFCSAQEFHVPASVAAGEETTIATSGSGKAAFYLIGPGVSRKSDVNLGEEIRLGSDELQNAGQVLAILCASTCQSQSFYVNAAKPASLAFLVHPSRVPAGQADAVSGVAFPFDRFHNLVQTPAAISFQMLAGKSSLLSRSERTQGGVAWFRTASGKSAGTVQVIATLDDVSARRAVQQVASDPCNLKIKGERTKAGIELQTEPVHDCAGNVVPDGTIVTFSATAAQGRSTVDAPVKQGIARAQVESSGPTVISVASGVVMGNELRIEGQR